MRGRGATKRTVIGKLASIATANGASGRWQRDWQGAIRDPKALLDALGLTDPAIAHALDRSPAFPLRVPRAFVARMRYGDPADPLLRQVLPLDVENATVEGYGVDAVGDLSSRARKGVLTKYRGRALLIATGSCAIHCRYCFRRHFPYADEHAATDGFAAALEFIAGDAAIDEVILSGGDPLSLATPKLAALTGALVRMPQVRRLRIHTRLPVVLPSRVDAELLDWIGSIAARVVVVIHANHANEIDAEVARASGALAERGATLLNQSVLLRGVNDSVDALATLSERLIEIGVVPYYLHQLDRVAGAAHFAVDDADALSLIAAVRARLSGYLVPRLVREVEGEASKTPLDSFAFGL